MGAVANEIDAYGELYLETPGKLFELADAGTFYQLTGVDKGFCFNMCVDEIAGTWTAEYDGLYKLEGSATMGVNIPTTVSFVTHINEEGQEKTRSTITFGNAGVKQTMSGSGLLNLLSGDVVTVKAASIGNNIELTIDSMNINFSRYGLANI